MAEILILGGGFCGLGTALLLARDGHDVTVLERDPDPLPDQPQAAWDVWARRGVAQFRQPHNFMPGLRRILEAELPELLPAFRGAGASRFDLIRPLPPFIEDPSPRPIDEELWTWTARRPLGEWVLGSAADAQPRLTVRRGVRAAELLAGPPVSDGIPHVVGVRTTAGEELRADLVVDAMGRRSRTPEWLSAIGARPPYQEREDCGFTYYTRYFAGTEPERAAPVVTELGTISVLTLPGDNGTWSVTIFTSTRDAPLKALRHPEKWTDTIRACPLHAHWLEGEPITDVLPMSGVVDRYRRFVVEGAPVATGLAPVADAWACTNPSAGRGLTVGFQHAVLLRDLLRDGIGDPRTLAEAFDDRTEAEVAPWYHAQIATDRARFAEIEALRCGQEPPPPQGLARRREELLSAAVADPDLFRAVVEYVATLTPLQDIVARPDVVDRVRAVKETVGDPPAPDLPGPDRQQLLEIMG